MIKWLTSDIRQAFLNQRVILWLGQSYGWQSGLTNERLQNEADKYLARVPWRAVYSDSPVPILEETIKEVETKIPQENRVSFRSPIAIARPGQDENLVLSQFLPIYYLNGRLRSSNKEDGFGQIPERLRAVYRSSLLLGIRKIAQESAIVLIDFEPTQLSEVIKDVRDIAGHTVPIIVLGASFQPDLFTDDEHLIFLESSPVEFLNEIEAHGLLIPIEKELTASVIVGNVRVRIDDILQGPMGRLDDIFRVVTSEALKPVPNIDKDLFDSFMMLNETRDAVNAYQDRKEWSGFASGLYVTREYKATENKSLHEYILDKLDEIYKSGTDGIQNITMQLPVHYGTGTTTLLHHVAHTCAKKGHPTFVLKQDATDISLGQLSNVLTDLYQRARDTLNSRTHGRSADEREIPCVLIFDTQHSEMDEVFEAAHRLAQSGRRCLVLRAYVQEDAIDESEDVIIDRKRIKGSYEYLPALTPGLTEKEITVIHEHFEKLRRNHNLPLAQRNLDDWRTFQKRSSFKVLTDVSIEEAESLFWVALHYFISGNEEGWLSESIQSNLSRRLHLLLDEDPLCVKTLLDISRFSLNGLYVDLQFLSRLEGNTFSSDVLERTKKLETQQLIRFRWEEGTGSNLYRLRHRLFAQLFIRDAFENRPVFISKGVPDTAIPASVDEISKPLWMLVPYLETLDGSISGDIRLAEEISEGVLRIISRYDTAWRNRNEIIEAFKKIPDVIHESSRAINHHHGMVLWKTAKYDNVLSSQIRKERFKRSIELFDKSLKIPARTHERDEHPGHILTSRAYSLWHWSQQLSDDPQKRSGLESESIDNFREAISKIPDNRYATYGLARSLITVCEQITDAVFVETKSAMVTEALDLLQGDPAPDFATNWFALRERAMRLIDEAAPAKFRVELRSRNEEAGYLLEAWAIIKGILQSASKEMIEGALSYLDSAIENHNVNCTWRTYHLAYNLKRLHPEFQNDFYKNYQLLRTLEKSKGFTMKPRDLFEMGVLCFQLDMYKEGFKVFRTIRASGAHRNLELESQPFWSENASPYKPRLARLRVKRVETPYKGWAYIEEFNEDIPFRPAHFNPDGTLRSGEIMKCYIRFMPSGPIAVPERFYRSSK